MRILVSASSLSPYGGSEPGVGWNIVSRLASYHETHVITKPIARGNPDWNFKNDIERYFNDKPAICNLHLHWIPHTPLSELLQVEGGYIRKLTYYNGYAHWQRACYRYAKRLCGEVHFDLVHHLTLTSFREPGYLWRLPLPFFWGPLLGAQMFPKAFFSIMSKESMILYKLRNLINKRQMKSLGRCKLAATKATHIWAATPEDHRMVTELWGCRAELMSETGTVPMSDRRPRRLQSGSPLKLVWSGVHTGRKALPLLLRALATLPELTRVSLTILGSGPETAAWRKLADQLGLSQIIHWDGNLPRDQAIEKMDNCHVLVFTGLKEGTTNVVLEALSLGLPVICHDACGMALAVTSTCGIKIPVIDPETSIDGFAAAIRRFVKDPELLNMLSRGALVRAEELTWDKKVERICSVYESKVDLFLRNGGFRKLPE